MNELRAVLEGLAGAGRRGESAVLATVVRVQGSAYRRPGARLLLLPDGRSVGTISGGCLEGDVARRAAKLAAEPGPVAVRYDTTSDAEIVWEFGLGCKGVVDVLLESVGPGRQPPYLEFLHRCLARRLSGVVARVVRVEGGDATPGGALTLDERGEGGDDLATPGLAGRVRAAAADVLRLERSRHATFESAGGRLGVFLELVRPPPSLLVCGAGHDAVPVVRLAKGLGWEVAVCDRRAGYATRERFPDADHVVVCRPADLRDHFELTPRTAAVVMTHNYLDDQCLLEVLLSSPLPYIGILGARDRTESLFRRLAAGGSLPGGVRPARLHAPVGLDVGAETPEEIALAIVAEVRAVFAGRPAGFLRDRRGAIHAPAPDDEAPAAPPTWGDGVPACAVRAE